MRGFIKGLATTAIAIGASSCDEKPTRVVAPSPSPSPSPSASPSPPAPINFTTSGGWRIQVHDGAITIRPRAGVNGDGVRYTSRGVSDTLGTVDLSDWAGDRRTLILADDTKVTMRRQGSALLRISIYDGASSREIDVLTQTVTHDQNDAALAQSREAAEHDGETAEIHASVSNYTYSPDSIQLVNLYQQGAATDGTPQERVQAYKVLGRQYGDRVQLPQATPAAADETDATCDATPQPRGGLTRNATGTLTYLSRSGKWRVLIDRHTITISYVLTGTGGMTWEVWGDPHENLNGKHIKDWETARRTLILPDGTKLTMHADGPHHVVHTVSIYDGAQAHEIGNVGNIVRYSCVNAAAAQQRETAELDGEAAYFTVLRSAGSADGGLFVQNVYNETAGPGGAAQRELKPAMLGITGEQDINPNQINDYYDDPRLGHS